MVHLLPQSTTMSSEHDTQLLTGDAGENGAFTDGDALLWSALNELTLNIAQTASLCGVSVRQLGYWTKQGYISARGKGSRRLYAPESIKRILRIRSAMNHGLSLRQALRSLEEAPNNTASLNKAKVTSLSPLNQNSVQSQSSFADPSIVSADILNLFQSNIGLRDTLSGLAAKIGRAPRDIALSLEPLLSKNLIARELAGDEAIYVHV